MFKFLANNSYFNVNRHRNVKKRRSVFSGKAIDIGQEKFEADLELHDRYISFSSELLKLSLAGIGVVGFLLTLIIENNDNLNDVLKNDIFVLSIKLSLVTFSIAAAFSLLHRYLAADGLYHHIKVIKYLIINGQTNSSDKKNNSNSTVPETLIKSIEEEEDARNNKYQKSGICLLLSSILLALGAICTGVAFIALI